jgi:hypothetical protein
MSQLDPAATSVNDVCLAALKEAGVIGVGQTALADDITDAWARLQWMLQQWERWLVYQLKTYSILSTGAQSYTIGPGGQLDTGAGSVRPAKIESAFTRQLTQASPYQIDYPCDILQSMEDYNRIRLKTLSTITGCVFLDPGWPLGIVYPYPVPPANTYSLFITVLQQLPVKFANLAVTFALPYEYYGAMVFNLALRLRPKYQIPTYPGDPLPGMAADSLNVLRGANTAIARLQLPAMGGNSGYNIFTDQGN